MDLQEERSYYQNYGGYPIKHVYVKRIHMEYWQNCEENELRPVNNWITTSTAAITSQLWSESRLPAAQQENKTTLVRSEVKTRLHQGY